jgi:hypothetical protein
MREKSDDYYSLRTGTPEDAGSDVSHRAIGYEYDWAIIVCYASEFIGLWDKPSLSPVMKQDFSDGLLFAFLIM